MPDTALSDTGIADEDESRYEAGVRACAAHLKDLVARRGATALLGPPRAAPADLCGADGRQQRISQELFLGMKKAPLIGALIT